MKIDFDVTLVIIQSIIEVVNNICNGFSNNSVIYNICETITDILSL
jgi:hypothetical protein